MALTVAVLFALWAGIVAPLVFWYGTRSDEIEQRALRIDRMIHLTQGIPALLAQAANARSHQSALRSDLLPASSDAVAAAALQQTLQVEANDVSAPLSSIETLAVEPRGKYRRIALRVTLSATWPQFLHLLQALEQGTPRVLIDDLQLSASPVLSRPAGVPVNATFTILAFRKADVS
ncbi:hypothetical protein ACELLULO517_23130 [Acidisoma cellulosilytica]|uniref:General secretion pathway protein GspM n=1 Tax=Acidisoma cellulosilyticum TaxID=2802395 RepID=A0A963Z5Y7_9PROT|nr:type II secretion system protein GspM [Acidisoma cellulosilyticum]MCB8883161.1 hypothetical protein [Acidisoma cellulosilyticum]